MLQPDPVAWRFVYISHRWRGNVKQFNVHFYVSMLYNYWSNWRGGEVGAGGQIPRNLYLLIFCYCALLVSWQALHMCFFEWICKQLFEGMAIAVMPSTIFVTQENCDAMQISAIDAFFCNDLKFFQCDIQFAIIFSIIEFFDQFWNQSL